MSNELIQAPELMTESGFEFFQRMATMMASSQLVPKDYQGSTPDKVANCLIAINLANRLKVDPLMVMQSLFLVHGRPGWSAQFLISQFNTCGRFSSLEYNMTGEGDSRGCYAHSKVLATNNVIRGTTVTLDMAKAEGWVNRPGSKWKTMQEQMLKYRAATFLIRAYAPELALGYATADELQDVHEASPASQLAMQLNEELKSD